MIYFTADLHLGHENIIKYCNRPFKSVEEMDETIINNINSVVRERDNLYVLGDFALYRPDYYSKKIKAYEVNFIPGSHDKKLPQHLNANCEHRFILPSIDEFCPDGLLDEYGNKRLIVMCHYSMRSWNKSHYASYHLFAHHHGRLEPYGLSFDVGVDTNNFFPYSLDDIEKKMKTLKPVVDFRIRKEK